MTSECGRNLRPVSFQWRQWLWGILREIELLAVRHTKGAQLGADGLQPVHVGNIQQNQCWERWQGLDAFAILYLEVTQCWQSGQGSELVALVNRQFSQLWKRRQRLNMIAPHCYQLGQCWQ